MRQGLYFALTFLLFFCLAFNSWLALGGTQNTSAWGSAKPKVTQLCSPYPALSSFGLVSWVPQLSRQKVIHTPKLELLGIGRQLASCLQSVHQLPHVSIKTSLVSLGKAGIWPFFSAFISVWLISPRILIKVSLG